MPHDLEYARLSRDIENRPELMESWRSGSVISPRTALQLGRLQFINNIRSGLPLFLFDGIAAWTSLLLANFAQRQVSETPFTPNSFSFVALILLTWFVQHVHGLYPACGLTHSIEFRRVLRTSLLVTLGVWVGILVGSADRFPLAGLTIFSLTLTALLVCLRPFLRMILANRDWWAQPVVIIGSSNIAIELYERLQKNRREGLRPLGIVFDPDVHWAGESHDDKRVFIGPISDLEDILLKTRTSRISVAEKTPERQNNYQMYHGIPHVSLPTNLEKRPTEKSQLWEHDGRVELHCTHTITCPTALLAKRMMDLALVIGSMPFWLPVMLVITVAIKFCDYGPALYRQKRVGRLGKSFYALKFRSMVRDADKILKTYLEDHPELRAEWESTHKLKTDPRVTWIGAILRKTSLDELPQLWNVLRGDMSLVGPRPIIDSDEYDRKYIEEHPEVFELYQYVRPGITGLWQISGRNSVVYEKRIHYDRIYLHNWSVMMDIFILWRTVKTALFREGAF